MAMELAGHSPVQTTPKIPATENVQDAVTKITNDID